MKSSGPCPIKCKLLKQESHEIDNSEIFNSSTWFDAYRNHFHSAIDFSQRIDSMELMPGALQSLKI